VSAPYPADICIVPRRRYGRAWVAVLAAVAAILVTLAWPHRAVAPRPRPAAALAHQVTHPASAKAAVSVTISGKSYACAVPVKPKPRH
jgi:hypothetical protein